MMAEEEREKKIQAAKQEAHQIIEQAQAQGSRQAQEMLEQAKADVGRVVTEAKNQIKSEKETMLREVKTENTESLQKGTEIVAGDVFKAGDIISVTAVSKGKGFAGVVKRHHFKGGSKTHGQSDRQRHPGSIGATTTPGRVLKGKRMAGRMGGEKTTVKGLMVVSIDDEKGGMAVSGAVPGATGSLLLLEKIHSGKLKELVEETIAQVVEGKEEAETKEDVTQKEEAKTEGTE